MTMGDAMHYHGAGDDRYGHRHPFLHINHEHLSDVEGADVYQQAAATLLNAVTGGKEPRS